MSLLSAETVGGYLVCRGLVEPDTPVIACELGGGVSNVVLAVDAGPLRAVVKQALPRLRVEDEWLAKRERALTEAAGLRLAARFAPGSTPGVLDVDEDACALTIERAPAGWRTWKDGLLAGEADPAVAGRLGEILSAWHRRTAGDEEVARRFGDWEAFEQLRVDPYHRTVMRRRPELGAAVGAYVERMETTRACFVHGDYSPKNVLVGSDGLWVLDFEVAHVGDPAFDLAFMMNHLMLKAIHRPAGRAGFESCAFTFWRAYGEVEDPPYVLGQLGCLMVARVDGKSPAEYLTEPEREVARALGADLLLHPPASPEKAWGRL